MNSNDLIMHVSKVLCFSSKCLHEKCDISWPFLQQTYDHNYNVWKATSEDWIHEKSRKRDNTNSSGSHVDILFHSF